MKFTTLIDHHRYIVEVEMNSGKVFRGLITSHTFENDSMENISDISILGDYTIDKVICKDIKSIKKLELNLK